MTQFHLLTFDSQNIQIMESQSESREDLSQTSPQYAILSLRNESQIVKNLLNLIANQVALELYHVNPHINDRLKSTYEEILIQLKVDLRKIEKLKLEKAAQRDQASMLEVKVKEHIAKIVKLKEISIYFNQLFKQSSSLERDVEKFLFYQPKSENLQEKLQAFFSSPLVSELFLKEYEKSFNMNNFSADLIDFFHFLQENGLLQAPPCETYTPVRNKDLQLIQNTNIIFRQICDINDKYAHVEQQMENAYVHLHFIKTPQEEEDLRKNKYKAEEGIIHEKFMNLKTIFHKIKCIYGGIEFNNFESQPETIILPEEPSVFAMLDQSFEFHFNSRNEQFLTFLEDLYDPSMAEGFEEPGKVLHFDFLKKKIIKAQTRWHLNRLISAFNVGSHIANLLQSSLNLTHNSYSFISPWILSKYEFNSTRMNFYSKRSSILTEMFILNKNTLITKRDDSYHLQAGKDTVIYPSAINNYFYFLRFLYIMSSILQEKGLYKEELMLELVQIKADEMMEWAEIVINLFDIIKAKYFRCYNVLQKYVSLIFQLHYQQELDFLQKNLKGGAQGTSQVLQRFISKEKKAGCISQIIFELESDYDIREALIKLYQIEKMHRGSFYCTDAPYFYEKILNQIIQTKNNLKFDRCLSFNALHQTFGFLAARPNDLKDLAQQLTPLSKNYLRLPDLLRFYAAQTKLKREVFKAQLYWITIAQPSVKNKFIINSQRKKINFRDFLQENAKNILCLTQKPLSYFLTSLEQFERSVFLFSQEVERLRLIQSSLLYLKPDFPLEDHISAFSHKELVTFFNYCSHFNLIEDLFLRREKKNWILSNIKKFIANGKLRFSDLSLDPTIVAMKQQLANYIFFIFSFQHHYTYDDCIKLIQRVVKGSEPPEYALKLEILRSKRDLLKEYEQSQFMEAPSLSQLTQIYQLLLLISINKLLRTNELDKKDTAIFMKIRNHLPFYDCFKAVDALEALQSIKQFSCTTSQAHALCGLKSILVFYRDMKEKSKKYQGEWEAIENMGSMAELGIVSRRLFCNEIIELKRIVSADEWRSFSKATCLNNLKEELDKEFTQRVNDFIRSNLVGISQLDLSHSLGDNINILEQLFKKQIFTQYDEKYSLQVVKKDPIILFDEFRGYEVETITHEQSRPMRRNIKNHRTNFKRGMLNTLKREDQGSTQVINNLQHRINLQIVKQSLPIRKLIYQLQLQGKRIRDQISWQTCKLQHNVITKINKFIEESTQDQKQSLTNFKYAVNLETIKGIENVIHERTQMFYKNSQQELTESDHSSNGFITEPKSQEEKGKSEEETLLDLNVRNIFNHVKKLKIFWAWKNIHLKRLSNEDEWIKFSENVEKILHNSDNLKRMENLQQLRENCNRHEIICNLIKEENVLLNNSIKSMKVNTLTKKLNSFKQKYEVGHQDHPDDI